MSKYDARCGADHREPENWMGDYVLCFDTGALYRYDPATQGYCEVPADEIDWDALQLCD